MNERIYLFSAQINPSRLDPGRIEKINLNLYFRTTLTAFIKPFEAPPKKCENKDLS